MNLQVHARAKWTDTQVVVEAGARLRFEARGIWRDWTIDADPDGFEKPYLAPLSGFRRLPREPWFALCGALDRDEETAFRIGTLCDWTAPAEGRLFVFANDVPWAYFNNKGEIDLSIVHL